MKLHETLMLALAGDQGMRRPSMPEGMMIVPVMRKALCPSGLQPGGFLVAQRADSRCPDWHATMDDLAAADWEIADWRASTVERLKSCG